MIDSFRHSKARVVAVAMAAAAVCTMSFAAGPGQGRWMAAKRLDDHAGISFEWRVVGRDGIQKKNQVEWRFASDAGRRISFSYRITTDAGEDRIGRMSLRPGEEKHAGWLFAGDAVLDVEVIDVVPDSSGAARGR